MTDTVRTDDGMRALGDRQKAYEAVEARRRLDLTKPIYARIDGRGFSKFTRSMVKPFDARLSDAMVEVTRKLVQETGASLGYTQSDEISLLWYVDRESKPDAEVFFGGKVLKMATGTASRATSAMMLALFDSPDPSFREYARKEPRFDCRIHNVPDLEEAANAFLWREMDAERNAVSMAAQALYPHGELDRVGTMEARELIAAKGVDFVAYPKAFRHGTWVRRATFERTLTSAERERIPPANRPETGATFLRTEVASLDMRMRDVSNRVGVLLGERPIPWPAGKVAA